MKKMQRLLAACALVLLPAIVLAGAPHEIAGFVLGKPISEFEPNIKTQTFMPLRNSPFLHEVETVDSEGFKNGLLWVGNCTTPPRIVRIRMKYVDSSEKFYNQLLERFKKRFGDPDEWRGDPFHVVIAWKWSFVDEQKNSISMILEHNTRDVEEATGNTIKLTMWNLIEKERDCAYQKEKKLKQTPPAKTPGPVDWERMLPR
jgi:hypothetical protein